MGSRQWYLGRLRRRLPRGRVQPHGRRLTRTRTKRWSRRSRRSRSRAARASRPLERCPSGRGLAMRVCCGAGRHAGSAARMAHVVCNRSSAAELAGCTPVAAS
ncbi:hypothetical protein DEH84_01305 [Aquabacterium olei]|uniref:Uncharacterized protein n=1 Tax=Aquabacterium olei TaxID=1296669 RepID=A0A2U8FVW4_9BURK|nr:hypothetical protein DEH84_01305 [Aquabacterium olei]